MYPFVTNGDVWRVIRVPAGDPRLVDRTDKPKLATTDATEMAVYVREDITPPLLDKVILHEVTHAITVSWGLLDRIRAVTPPDSWIDVEEWSAQLMENHALEATRAASVALGRPVCVRGVCD